MRVLHLEGCLRVFFAPLEFGVGKLATNMRVLEEFDRVRIPVVLLDREVYVYPERSRCNLVGIDKRRAGYIVTSYMLGQDCERVVFLSRQTL